MRRKFLETTAPAPMTKEKGDITLTAKVIEDVLEVDVYEKGNLLARHFIEKAKRKHATLFMKNKKMLYGSRREYTEGEWSDMKLETLLADGETQITYWRIEKKNIKTGDEHEKVILSYLEKDEEHWLPKNRAVRVIESVEDDYRYENRVNAIDRKEKRIEKMMEKVEEITETKDFRDWLMKIFPERYIFTENQNYRRGKRYYCATCGENFYNKGKWKHNSVQECKKCGTKAIVKTRTMGIYEKKSVIVLQQYDKDTVVERIFRFQHNSWLKDQKAYTEFRQQERIRLFLKKGSRTKIFYGTSNRTDADEYEQEWWTTKNGMLFDKKYLVYPGTIQDTTLPKILKDELMAGAKEKKEMDYNALVYAFEKRPFLEYLFKGKMLNLASEIISQYGYGDIKFLNENAKNVSDLLKLDKQRVNRMKEVDGNSKTLKALQWEMKKGEKISQENLIYITENKIGLDELRIEKTGLSVNKAVNYLRRQIEQNKMKQKQILQFYQDYLDMAADRGMDLRDDIVRVNKRMIEFHNLYLEEKNRKANEKRAKNLNRRFANITKNYQENKEKYGFETEEYIFILPKSAEDIMIEGQKQHHCVGASDTYFDRMNKGESFIVFMRKKCEPEVPYYTIEIKDTEIKQAYSAYDRQPDYQNVKKELNKWKQEIGKRMRKEQEDGRIAS